MKKKHIDRAALCRKLLYLLNTLCNVGMHHHKHNINIIIKFLCDPPCHPGVYNILTAITRKRCEKSWYKIALISLSMWALMLCVKIHIKYLLRIEQDLIVSGKLRPAEGIVITNFFYSKKQCHLRFVVWQMFDVSLTFCITMCLFVHLWVAVLMILWFLSLFYHDQWQHQYHHLKINTKTQSKCKNTFEVTCIKS